METIIGFAAGYLAGCREGKDGLARLKTSLVAIRDSPEMRRLAGEAVSLAEVVVRRTAVAGISGTLGVIAGSRPSPGPGRRAA